MKAPVSNPNFVTWFAGSKVVDESGAPRVVYHGTYVREVNGRVVMGDIEAFDRMVSVNIVRRKASIDTVGVWFSTNPGKDGAEMYGNTIYPVYLAIRDPYITTFDTMLRRARLLANGLDDGRQVGAAEVEALRKWLQESGRDGIRIVKGDSSTEFDAQDAWIALEPTQIKSAISNSGHYAPTCADMTDGAAASVALHQPVLGGRMVALAPVEHRHWGTVFKAMLLDGYRAGVCLQHNGVGDHISWKTAEAAREWLAGTGFVVAEVELQSHDRWSGYQERSAQIADGMIRWVEDASAAYVTDIQAGQRVRGRQLLQWLCASREREVHAVGVVEAEQGFWDKMEEEDLIQSQTDEDFMSFFGRAGQTMRSPRRVTVRQREGGGC